MASVLPTNDLKTRQFAWREKWDYYPGVQLVLFNRLLRFLRDSDTTRASEICKNPMLEFKPRLTYIVELAGGQNRLRQMILYVSKVCLNAERFGLIKLNKILWKSDFVSYAERRVPVSGRRYQREKFGPVPRDMLPLHREMENAHQIRVEQIYFDENIVEHRTIPLVEPDLSMFNETDIEYIDKSIKYYWHMTGMETSDDSHGVAWRTRSNGEAIPYEAAYLSDDPIGSTQLRRLQFLAAKEGWTSD